MTLLYAICMSAIILQIDRDDWTTVRHKVVEHLSLFRISPQPR